jgi:hypothetical protein
MDYANSRNLNAQRGDALHIDAHDVAPSERGIGSAEGSMRWIAAIVFTLIALGIATFLYG